MPTIAAGDGCQALFAHAYDAARPPLHMDGTLLELGCAEDDWLTPALQAFPRMTLIGVDVRACTRPAAVVVGNLLDPDLFAAASFDTIVAISALEHVGLGHYGDPVQADGDTVAVANAWRWLKPGGWLYLDVPWNVSPGYTVCGSSHRIYDQEAITARLAQCPWIPHWMGVGDTRGTLSPSLPTQRLAGCKDDFYVCAWWWQKPQTWP